MIDWSHMVNNIQWFFMGNAIDLYRFLYGFFFCSYITSVASYTLIECDVVGTHNYSDYKLTFFFGRDILFMRLWRSSICRICDIRHECIVYTHEKDVQCPAKFTVFCAVVPYVVGTHEKRLHYMIRGSDHVHILDVSLHEILYTHTHPQNIHSFRIKPTDAIETHIYLAVIVFTNAAHMRYCIRSVFLLGDMFAMTHGGFIDRYFFDFIIYCFILSLVFGGQIGFRSIWNIAQHTGLIRSNVWVIGDLKANRLYE